MADINPISDGYIDGIIKANQTGSPDPNRTSGAGLRELIKQMRDRFEQELNKISGWIRMSSINPAVTAEDLELSYKGDFVADTDRAIVYVQGQFYLSGNLSGSITLGKIAAGYRPSKNITHRANFGSSDIYVLVQTNGEVKLQTTDGSTLVTGQSEPYTINLFYRPALAIPDTDRLIVNSVMLTAFDEFGFDTTVQLATTPYGGGKALNAVYEQIKLRQQPQKTDFSWMMDEDMYLMPDLEEAVMWINWFSPAMHNPTHVLPYIQETVKLSIATDAWNAGGLNAGNAIIIPQELRGSGSMNDMSFVRGALELQSRGVKPGIVPVLSTLDVNGNTGNYLNWRGYIFFDNIGDFHTWLASYETFIKYYIDLCKSNHIDLGTIYVGSEFQCLMTTKYEDSPGFISGLNIPQALRDQIKAEFINKLGELAAYSKTAFPSATITYAANWTEYNVLDDLWAKPAIDGIGIDWYFPVIEKHTNVPAEILPGVFGGEYADYYYQSLDPANYKLSTTNGNGKAGITKVPISAPTYLNALKYVREYRTHLQSLGINKPVMATELGVASCNGSGVLPNVFPVLNAEYNGNTEGNIAPSLPDSHNMKAFLQTLSQFSYQVKDIQGPYGSTFEMDEEQQFITLKTISQELAAAEITKQVIYTLDARYSGMFGATIFNTETEQDEVYTSDTAIFPLNHALNAKKAGGNAAGDLLTRITPHSSTGTQLPESSASVGVGSFVNTDLYDLEWKQEAPSGFTLVSDDGTQINPNKDATGIAGRFAYFTTMGQRTPTVVPVSGTLNFEARGDGKIEVVVFSATDLTSIQGRRVFSLTDTYKVYSWDMPALYPQLECIIGVFFNGENTTGQVTASFKKNFALILDQAGMSGQFTRYRADVNNLMGNSETAWYGWSDHENTAKKKYLQSSAYSRFKFTTNADHIAVEYVRDFYNAYPKNVYVWTQVQSGKVLSASGTVISGVGAVNTYTRVSPGQTYTISGLHTTQPEYVWMDINETPISAKMNLSNVGTTDHPLYQITAPSGAARLGLLVQKFLNPSNYKDPINDKYTVYSSVLIEPGTIGDHVHLGPPNDNNNMGVVPTEFKTYMGTVPSRVSGLSIFVTQNGTTTDQYLELEEGLDLAKQVQIITATLPAGTKTVEIVHNGRGTYLPADPDVRRAGTYMRAVYFPQNTSNTLITTPVNPIVFVGDSIISGFNISSNAPKNVWIQKIARDPAFGYQGDVFSESYAGRILHTNTSTPEKLEAFTQKLASFKSGNVVPNFWFQIGVNDYSFTTPIAQFSSEYPGIIDRLHQLLPSAKIYIQTIGPDFYEGPNAETHDPDDPDIATGPTMEDFRNIQRSVANNRPYTELVEFKNLFPPTIVNVPDGIHPSDTGNSLYAQGIRDKSNLLNSHPVILSLLPDSLPYFIQNNAYSQQLTTSGGAFPYSYTVTAGSLPSGVTLTAAGLLSGTPSVAPQSFSFTIQSTDANGIFITKTFTGDVTDTISGVPESTASLGIGSFINPDIYSEEWKLPTPASYANVTDDGNGVINADHSATGNAGRFAYFKVDGDSTVSSPVYITGTLSFEAKGTGTLEVVIFAGYQDGIQLRKACALTSSYQAFSMDLSLYPALEYYIGFFFSGMNTVGPVSATFKKNIAIKLNQFGLTGNFKRLRADATTLTGNVESMWYGRSYDASQKAIKYLQASAYSFLRLDTDATSLVIEYVRDFYNQTNNNISGFTVFWTIDNISSYQYIDLEAIVPQQYNISLNQVKVSLPSGSKRVEVVMPGRTLYTGYTPQERLGSTFLRAVYLPAGSALNVVTSVHPESVCFIGDSIISGYLVSINSQRNVWIHQIHRWPEYAYPGDIFSESYAGRYLYSDIATDALMTAFVTKLSQYPVNKYWIQLAVNDYYKVGSSDQPGSTIDSYKTRYGLFLDALHAAKPDAKIYLQTIGPIANESANGPSGNNVAAFRNAVISVGSTRTAFCEVVDFAGLFNGSDTSFLPDGLHPADPAQHAYAEGIRLRSSLLNVSALSISPTSLGTITQGIAYALQFVANGGTGNKSFSYSGTLPNNMTFVAGLLSGTPTTTTAYDFIVTVTDEASTTASLRFTGSVNPVVITVMPVTINDIVRGTAVNLQLSASGGISPYLFALGSGALPAGLSLSSSGLMSGTATTAVNGVSFGITVTDQKGNSQTKQYTVNVVIPTINLSPGTLGPVTTGNGLTDQLTASGGINTYTFAITSGVLPAGLTLNANGTFAGVVTAEPNTYTVTITATDGGGNTGSKSYTIIVSAVNITFSPDILTNRVVNNAVSQQLSASGGVGTYTYQVTAGTLPAGLTLSPSGLLTGTPSGAETQTFTVTATDAHGNVGTKQYTLTIVSLSKVLVLSGSLSGTTLTITATITRTFPDTVYVWTNIYAQDGTSYLGGQQIVIPIGQTSASANANNINPPAGSTSLVYADMNIYPATSDGTDITYDPVQRISI